MTVSAFTFILSIVAALALMAVAAGLVAFRSMFMPTRGRRIPRYPSPQRALVVLDIQEGYTGRNPRQAATARAASGLIGTVNRLIDAAAQTGMEVAYIRQVFRSNLFVRLHGGRRQGRVIVDRRVRVINENDFEKNRTDAFSSRAFEQFLRDHQVDELFLVGVDAAFCVYYTALGALNRGYKVHVVADAVRSRYKMAKVLERYRRKGISYITSDRLTHVPAGEKPGTSLSR